LVIFRDFDEYFVNEEDFQGLLSMLPESTGGLAVIAAGLFHPHPLVRLYITRTLQRAKSFPSINPAVGALGSYMNTCLQRQLSKMTSGALQDEVKAALQAKKNSSSSIAPSPRSLKKKSSSVTSMQSNNDDLDFKYVFKGGK
jgi:hypothetical protein